MLKPLPGLLLTMLSQVGLSATATVAPSLKNAVLLEPRVVQETGSFPQGSEIRSFTASS